MRFASVDQNADVDQENLDRPPMTNAWQLHRCP
ncbi:hypothetical protein COOONC_18967 [Cooperia oncophora]